MSTRAGSGESDALHPPTAVAFEDWCYRQYPRVVAVLRVSLGGERNLAEDLAQETFVKAFLRWRTLADSESRDGWLYKVAINAALSHHRRRRVEQRMLQRLARTLRTDEDDSLPPALYEAVQRLPAREREVVLLRFVADLSVQEVARILKCAPGTVKAHSHHAIQKLRRDPLEDVQ